jgi:hypothetical protein
MGEKDRCIQDVVGRSEGKRQLGRPRCTREGNIKMDLQEVRWGGIDWIALARDMDRWWELLNAVMNFRVPQNAGDFLTSLEPRSFSRRALFHAVG